MADVIITITIPDAKVSKIKNALRVKDAQELKNWIIDRIRGNVLSFEQAEAGNAIQPDLGVAS